MTSFFLSAGRFLGPNVIAMLDAIRFVDASDRNASYPTGRNTGVSISANLMQRP